jgi:hypothetical protein
MSAITSATAWIESTQIARTVGGSMWLIASLSATHVIGYALVMGGALLASFGWLGLLGPRLPVADLTRAANRGIVLGLVISVVTGMLLVSWKAAAAAANGIFQAKMLLMVLAVVVHFACQRRMDGRRSSGSPLPRSLGAVGLALWVGLALASSAFILLE